MSPVSRGRKPKKTKKNKKQATKPKVPLTSEPVSFPDWFEEGVGNILGGVDGLLACETARDLEQATCELLGAELKRAIDDDNYGLDFDLFFAALVAEVSALAKSEPTEALWRLLHGLLAIAAPGVAPTLRSTIARVESESERLSAWPRSLADLKATGEVWEMRDVYGTRLAVIAAYTYPGVYLFDVDMSGIPALTGGHVYDDVEQATEAWRKKLGDEAGDAEPKAVTDTERLAGLVSCEFDVIGFESRDALDNWHRAQRRFEDLETALKKRNLPLPPYQSLFDDPDPAEMSRPFIEWHSERHGGEPDPEAVEDLAGEWMEGLVPDTRFDVSPGRIGYYLDVLGDRRDPVAMALLRKWACWLAERAGLPSPLVERVVAKATK
ncbi:hypothetical protein BS329_26725 [Amycolatopsis coloradensis]|uniref:Uncharacterized protein n=1 Tax=Amycolatopsis coloradensis TaxID=76021 RepID=A0A1R0KLF0_9PSEU|nr:hypothetical protein [Amycolatopsis coloradensis]OLZ47506.1 hypothetical protein BS329_26725 [Amycolatopsis coloradensis]